MAKIEYVSTFRAPTEYEAAAARARRQRALAEALAQQQYQAQDITAPIPSAAPVVQGLQAYLAARAARKAEEAESEKGSIEQRTAREIMGRLMGADVAPTTGDLEEVKPAGRLAPSTPEDLSEVNIESQYRYDPQGAMRKAMTTEGGAALRGNPLLAAALQKSMEAEKVAKSPYGSVDPSKFTQASLQRFDASVRSGKPDYTVLQPREYAELTPQQIIDATLRGGQYGIESGRFTFETGMPAPRVNFPFTSTAPVPAAPQAAPAGAAPAAVVPPQASRPAATPTDVPMSATASQPQRLAAALSTVDGKKKPAPAIDLATPQQRLKLEQDLPRARQAAQVGLSKLDQLDDYLADLEKHAGTEKITGLIGQVPIDIAPESRSARSVLQGFQQGASIQAINEARQASETGGAYGSMTVQEWPRLEGVFGAVVAAKDPEAFDIAVKNARDQIKAARDRYQSTWDATYGDIDIGYTKPKYTPESTKYPRQQPKPSGVRSQADAILRGE